jgi:small subunit ribosomal protein S17
MEKKTIKRTLEGIIVSDKMDKTRVVLVERMKKHPLYKKYYKASKKFKAHDGKNQYKEGDRVFIEASRPISKDKKWIIRGLVENK